MTIFRGLADRQLRAVLTVTWDETALHINFKSTTIYNHISLRMRQPFFLSLRYYSYSYIVVLKKLNMDRFSGQSTRFSTTNTALRAVKETQEHDESHVDFTRQCGKSPVTTSAVLHCVYLAWKHPRRRIKVTFQVSRPAFPPQTRPCVRSKRLRSTMNRTLTSPGSVVSPQSQRAQFSIVFILPRNTHAAGSR